MGDGFSVAWRVLDAQYWGVPQRRKRIYLVGDFGGQSAGKILFESEGLSGYSAALFRAWKDASKAPTGSAGTASLYENHGIDARYKGPLDVCPTLAARMGTGGNNGPLVLETFSASRNSRFTRANRELADCLTATDFKAPPIVNQYARVRRLMPRECARLQGFPDWWCDDLATEEPTENEVRFWADVFKDWGKPKTERQIIKWLKDPYTDAAAYKMWGNGVALPCVWYIMAGIKWAIEEEKMNNKTIYGHLSDFQKRFIKQGTTLRKR